MVTNKNRKIKPIIIAIIIILIYSWGCSSISVEKSPNLPQNLEYLKSLTLNYSPAKIIYNNFSDSYLCLDENNNTVYIYDNKFKLIQKIEQNSGINQFSNLSDVSFDSAGNLYVLDSDFNKIFKFDDEGQYISNINLIQTKEPKLIKIKNNGDFLIYDEFSNEIYCLSYNNKVRYTFGKFELIEPSNLCATLNLNYVLDVGTNKILVFDNFGSLIKTIVPINKILSLTTSKYFFFYLDSDSNIFIGKKTYQLKKTISKLSNYNSIKKPQNIFITKTGIGIIEINKVHLLQFSN